MKLKHFITNQFFNTKQEREKDNVSTTTTADTCLHCQTPIEQPKHGGRPRKYCKRAACRKAESRAQNLAVIRKAEQEQRDALEKTWLQFDSETREYLGTIVDEEGLAAACRATEAFIHLLTKEKQQREEEQRRKEDNSSPPKVPVKQALANASIADLMQETAARLNALSSKTPKEQEAFVDRYGLILGKLYASLVPYSTEDSKNRSRSLKLAQKYHKP